jgi:hypothetical protein
MPVGRNVVVEPPISADLQIALKLLGPGQRRVYRWHHALSSVPEDQDLLLLIDYLIYRPDWLYRASQAVEEARSHLSDEFVMLLFAINDPACDARRMPSRRRGRHYSSQIAGSLATAAATFFPKEVRKAFFELFSAEINRWNWPCEGLKEYVVRNQNLYVTSRSVVQRFDDYALSNPIPFISNSFDDPWPEESISEPEPPIRPDGKPSLLADTTLIVLTTPARTEYISDTVRLLRPDELKKRFKRVLISVQGEEPYPALPVDTGIEIVYLTKEESAALAKPDNPWVRLKQHTIKCFELAMGGPLLLLQDDVRAREGWIDMFEQSLEEMYNDGLWDFIVSLYYPSNVAADARYDGSLKRGRYYSAYAAHTYYGAQAMYFPTHIVAEMKNIFSDEERLWRGHPDDILIHHFCVCRQNLYAPERSLFQHVGRHTTGVGTWHEASTFDDPWPT